MSALRFLLWHVARFLLRLRYRIRVHGADKVRSLEGPILLLPNHPAFIDPILVLTKMHPLFHPRPFLFEGNFNNPLFRPLMSLLDAIRVPDLDQASSEARQRTAEAIENVKQALRATQNVLMWPSGRLQRTGVERLGAARTLAEVLRDVPEAKVVLIRTTGLWGSRFSYAFTGKSPPFFLRLVQGAGWILANLVFFAPRRNVDLTLEYVDRASLPGTEREVLNPYLENWYNQGDASKPIFVPVHFLFGPRTHDFPAFEANNDVDLTSLRPDVRRAVDEMIGESLKRDFAEGELKPEMTLEQMGLDSLSRMELSLKVEKRFQFSGDQVPVTVGQVYALAAGLLQRQAPKPPPKLWFKAVQPKPIEILGETIAEAFVERALHNCRDVICADDLSGALTYEKLLVGALSLSRRFAKLEGKNVGLMLPASVGCDVALLGLYLANKLPVILNFTTGEANLQHAVRTMGLTHVVTSKAFMNRLAIDVPGVSFYYLEAARQSIGKWELLRTLLRVRYLPDSVRSDVPKVDPNEPAVVLFTSGSEKAPKAVPLTHRNLILNQRSGTEILKPRSEDAIFGFLPAFHSFGTSITGLYPLLTGIRVVRHPDPTDAAALARKIGLYKPTILVGTPTFVSYVLERAEPGELRSLRMVILGAEKCPKVVFDRFAESSPGAVVLEGYGITECSPVVSVNPPEANRPGTVGKALRGVELSVRRFETDGEKVTEIGEELPTGAMGMLLVSGPTVFPGYLGYEGESPFREIDGRRWYVTGDLTAVDEDGYVHFSGRLKRFVKAGGEMISLVALEAPFQEMFPPTKNEGVRAMVEGVEVDGGRAYLVLFTTEAITLRESNEVLSKAGYTGLMRLDEVRRLEKIPVGGTGKPDWKLLRSQVLQPQQQSA